MTIRPADPDMRGIQPWSPYVDPTLGPSDGTITLGGKTYTMADYRRVSGTRNLSLGFVTSSDNKGTPAFGGQPTLGTADKTYGEAINGLRDAGGDVTMSFGGAANTMIDVYYHGRVDDLAKVYEKIITDYQLTKLDFDIEGAASADTVTNDTRAAALAQVEKWAQGAHRQLAISYTLPTLVEGLTSDGVNVLKGAVAAGLDLARVNIMTMDYGDGDFDPHAHTMAWAAEQAATNLVGQLHEVLPGKSTPDLWKTVGIVPMIGYNDVTSEVFGRPDASELVQWSAAHQVGTLSMWSVNRDQTGTKGVPGPTSSGVDQQPMDFARTFGAFHPAVGSTA